jgi:hypothetical protein
VTLEVIGSSPIIYPMLKILNKKNYIFSYNTKKYFKKTYNSLLHFLSFYFIKNLKLIHKNFKLTYNLNALNGIMFYINKKIIKENLLILQINKRNCRAAIIVKNKIFTQSVSVILKKFNVLEKKKIKDVKSIKVLINYCLNNYFKKNLNTLNIQGSSFHKIYNYVYLIKNYL